MKYKYDFDLNILLDISRIKSSKDEDLLELLNDFKKHIRRNEKMINIYVNGKSRSYNEIKRLMDNPIASSELETYLPKDNFFCDNIFKVYFLKQHKSFIESAENNYGFKIFNYESFKEHFENFISPKHIVHSRDDNKSFKWDSYKDTYISNNLILYESFMFKEKYLLNNIIPFLKSNIISSNSNVLILSMLDYDNVEKDAEYYYQILTKNIKKDLSLFIALFNKKLFDDRFIYCNNYYINANHSFQAFKNYESSIFESNKNIELNPSSMIDEIKKNELFKLKILKKELINLMESYTPKNKNYGSYYPIERELKNKLFDLVQ
jgi:hypothetical protein